LDLRIEALLIGREVRRQDRDAVGQAAQAINTSTSLAK